MAVDAVGEQTFEPSPPSDPKGPRITGIVLRSSTQSSDSTAAQRTPRKMNMDGPLMMYAPTMMMVMMMMTRMIRMKTMIRIAAQADNRPEF